MITLSGFHSIKNAIRPSLLDKSGTDKRKSINFLKQHSPLPQFLLCLNLQNLKLLIVEQKQILIHMFLAKAANNFVIIG